MRFPKVHDVLNKLRWDVDELDYAILTVSDRVSGTKEISGGDIADLRRREFDVRGEDRKVTTIPYYKVIRVVVGNEVIWARPKPLEDVAQSIKPSS